MFCIRLVSDLPTDSELDAQKEVWSLISDASAKPSSLLQAKAAVITRHASVDFIMAHRVQKLLLNPFYSNTAIFKRIVDWNIPTTTKVESVAKPNQIIGDRMPALSTNALRMLPVGDALWADDKLKAQVKEKLSIIAENQLVLTPAPNDAIQLPIVPSFSIGELEDPPSAPFTEKQVLEPLTLNYDGSPNSISLRQFEKLVFGENVLVRLYDIAHFAQYMYFNIFHVFNVGSYLELEKLIQGNTEKGAGHPSWLTRYATLLYQTQCNNLIAQEAFYTNKVTWGGVEYDTSFVPKYPVRSLQPLKRMPLNTTTTFKHIYAWETLDVMRARTVPKEFRSIFRIFPICKRHYVNAHTGRIEFIPLKPPQHSRTTALFRTIMHCSGNLEAQILEVASLLPLSEIEKYLVHSKTLLEQGVALLVARCKLGQTLRLGAHHIELPTYNEVLAWLPVLCNSANRHASLPSSSASLVETTRDLSTSTVIFPVSLPSSHKLVARTLALVQTISKCAVSPLAVSMLCSNFSLLACTYGAVLPELTSDCERYVLLTLYLQDYESSNARQVRAALCPQFPQKPACVQLPKSEFTCRLAKPARTVAKECATPNTPLACSPHTAPPASQPPTASSTQDFISTKCFNNPLKCPEYYRFKDSRLYNLCKHVYSVSFATNTYEQAAFIALCLQKQK